MCLLDREEPIISMYSSAPATHVCLLCRVCNYCQLIVCHGTEQAGVCQSTYLPTTFSYTYSFSMLLEDVYPECCLPWHRLIHVCRRWRSLVFSSPIFLNLKLVCGPWTRVELTSTIWPPLPITIRNMVDWPMPGDYDFDAAIVHPNRVREIDLHLTSFRFATIGLGDAGAISFTDTSHSWHLI